MYLEGLGEQVYRKPMVTYPLSLNHVDQLWSVCHAWWQSWAWVVQSAPCQLRSWVRVPIVQTYNPSIGDEGVAYCGICGFHSTAGDTKESWRHTLLGIYQSSRNLFPLLPSYRLRPVVFGPDAPHVSVASLVLPPFFCSPLPDFRALYGDPVHDWCRCQQGLTLELGGK